MFGVHRVDVVCALPISFLDDTKIQHFRSIGRHIVTNAFDLVNIYAIIVNQ